MKKLFIYGVTALAMLTGCNDLLDKSPLDTFTNTPAYWSNTDNLDNQCNTFFCKSGKLLFVPYTKDFGRITRF